MTPPFDIEVLTPGHDREALSGGVEVTDRHFLERATQNVQCRARACFVAVDAATIRVAGNHALAAARISLADLPSRSPNGCRDISWFPVARLGGLVVDRAYRRRNLGGAPQWDAGMRGLRSEIAFYASVVDAKDQQTAASHRHRDFVLSAANPSNVSCRWQLSPRRDIVATALR